MVYELEVSIIIVAYNSRELLENCIQSIWSEPASFDFEVIVVDSGSNDNTSVLKYRFPGIKWIFLEENLGFSRSCNLGADNARGQYLIFLNADTRISPSAIAALLIFAKSKENLGALAPQLLYDDGSIQPSCLHELTVIGAVREYWFDQPGNYQKYTPKPKDPSKVFCAVGACVLLPRTAFDLIGRWDERYFMYFEDVELGRRLKLHGYDYWYLPDVKVVHIHAGSTQSIPEISKHRSRVSSRIYHGIVTHSVIAIIIWLSERVQIQKNVQYSTQKNN